LSYPLVHNVDPSTIATYHFRPSHGVGAGLDSGVLFGGGLGNGIDSLVGSGVSTVGVGGVGVGGTGQPVQAGVGLGVGLSFDPTHTSS